MLPFLPTAAVVAQANLTRPETVSRLAQLSVTLYLNQQEIIADKYAQDWDCKNLPGWCSVLVEQYCEVVNQGGTEHWKPGVLLLEVRAAAGELLKPEIVKG